MRTWSVRAIVSERPPRLKRQGPSVRVMLAPTTTLVASHGPLGGAQRISVVFKAGDGPQLRVTDAPTDVEEMRIRTATAAPPNEVRVMGVSRGRGDCGAGPHRTHRQRRYAAQLFSR